MTVSDQDALGGSPPGTVTFASTGSGAFSAAPGSTFTAPAGCTLQADGTIGQSSCQILYAPSTAGTGTVKISATYPADSQYQASTAQTTIAISAPTSVSNKRLSVTLSGSGSGTVKSSPAGIDCPDTCTSLFAPGTHVTLSATPAGGSTFAGWSGDGCSGTGSCAITPGAASAVSAKFTAAHGRATLEHTAGHGTHITLILNRHGITLLNASRACAC